MFASYDGLSFKPYSKHSNEASIKYLPPKVHLMNYVTGGLELLLQQVKKLKKIQPPEWGKFTSKEGIFSPNVGMPFLARRYRFVDVVGNGQSCLVIRAQDVFNHDHLVAIKVLHTTYSELGFQEADSIRKLNIADPMCYSPVVRLHTTFMYDDHFCLVFELLDIRPMSTLIRNIDSQNEKLAIIRKIVVKLLQAVGFLQQQNIIHADLKLENIMWKTDGSVSSLKVIDFGNAIHCIHNEISLYYDDFELQTPPYRAPEVLFGMMFGMRVDLWSIGCIVAELFIGQPLFSGSSKKTILSSMVEILGPLPSEYFRCGKYYSSLSQFCANSSQSHDPVALMKHLGCSDYVFADFLSKLLRYYPAERYTITEAAEHEFLAAELGIRFLKPLSDNGASYKSLQLSSLTYRYQFCCPARCCKAHQCVRPQPPFYGSASDSGGRFHKRVKLLSVEHSLPVCSASFSVCDVAPNSIFTSSIQVKKSSPTDSSNRNSLTSTQKAIISSFGTEMGNNKQSQPIVTKHTLNTASERNVQLVAKRKMGSLCYSELVSDRQQVNSGSETNMLSEASAENVVENEILRRKVITLGRVDSKNDGRLVVSSSISSSPVVISPYPASVASDSCYSTAVVAEGKKQLCHRGPSSPVKDCPQNGNDGTSQRKECKYEELKSVSRLQVNRLSSSDNINNTVVPQKILDLGSNVRYLTERKAAGSVPGQSFLRTGSKLKNGAYRGRYQRRNTRAECSFSVEESRILISDDDVTCVSTEDDLRASAFCLGANAAVSKGRLNSSEMQISDWFESGISGPLNETQTLRKREVNVDDDPVVSGLSGSPGSSQLQMIQKRMGYGRGNSVRQRRDIAHSRNTMDVRGMQNDDNCDLNGGPVLDETFVVESCRRDQEVKSQRDCYGVAAEAEFMDCVSLNPDDDDADDDDDYDNNDSTCSSDLSIASGSGRISRT